jgi:hypothetical protein
MTRHCYADCHLCLVSLMLSVTYKTFMLSVIMLSVVSPSIHPWNAITNRGDSRSWLCRVFDSKLGSFTPYHLKWSSCQWPNLKLKTRPRFCLVSWGREHKTGKYHCTVDLLFDWFGISCMTTDIFLFLFAKQTNPNQSNRRSTVQRYFPF